MTLGTSQGPDRLGDHLWATKPIMWLGPDSEDWLRAFEFDPDRGGPWRCAFAQPDRNNGGLSGMDVSAATTFDWLAEVGIDRIMSY